MFTIYAIDLIDGDEPIILLVDDQRKIDSFGTCIPCAINYLKHKGETHVSFQSGSAAGFVDREDQALDTLMTDLYHPGCARSAEQTVHESWGKSDGDGGDPPPLSNRAARRKELAERRRLGKRLNPRALISPDKLH